MFWSKHSIVEQPQGLVSVLKNCSAREDERDDAAMDLSVYDEAMAIDALIEVASDSATPATLAGTCGESIAEIWSRNGTYSKDVYRRLTMDARSEIDLFFGNEDMR